MEKVRDHFKRNKKFYLGLAIGGVVVGVMSYGQNVQIMYKSPGGVQTLVRRGHPGFRVLDTQTGEETASIRRMAEVAGCSPTAIRNNPERFKIQGEM
jgi:hypothetical protein